MGPRSFFFRLMVPFAVLMALIVGLCGAVVQWAGEQQTRRQQIHDLDGLVPLVQRWVSRDPAVGEQTRLHLNEASELLRTRITLIRGDGSVLYDSHARPEGMNNHNGRPEVREARAHGTGAEVRHSNTIEEDSVYVARLADPQRPDGVVVRLSYPQHTWADLGTSAWGIVLGSVLAALLALVVLWLILNRQWIAPTRRLAEVAEGMAEGDWNRRAAPAGADELRHFSTRLNLVASHAQQQLADLKHQRADLQSLVDTLPDPVLVSDARGKVTLINSAAARLLDLSRARVLGEAVVNVVSDEAVLQLFDRVAAMARPDGGSDAGENASTGNGSGNGNGLRRAEEPSDRRFGVGSTSPPLTRELRLHRGGQWFTYQAVGTRTADGGVLLVLRDVTALAAAVQMKTDFVANASHELRTPIAAIKIAFETLREVYTDDAYQSERCMQIIDGHLGRLEEMLRDLLDMAKVEESNLKPHVRRIKTADLCTHLRASLGPMARQKLVELRFNDADAEGPDGAGDPDNPPRRPEEFLSDERLLNLVLKNLLENSIKFTPPGGTVTVSITETPDPRPAGIPVVVPELAEGDGGSGGGGLAFGLGRSAGPGAGYAAAGASPGGGASYGPNGDSSRPQVVISVSDTGIGIPPEHLNRVFERFYQVDAARSGSAGRGTGLGLAIVKHAVTHLRGTVHLASIVGSGTTVTCVLPQSLQPADENELGGAE